MDAGAAIMTGQPTGADARALYAAARRRGLVRTGDPQHGPPPAEVAALPDQSVRCQCGTDDPMPHSGYVHHLTKPSEKWPAGRLTYCTIVTEAGRCACPGYRPRV